MFDLFDRYVWCIYVLYILKFLMLSFVEFVVGIKWNTNSELTLKNWVLFLLCVKCVSVLNVRENEMRDVVSPSVDNWLYQSVAASCDAGPWAVWDTWRGHAEPRGECEKAWWRIRMRWFPNRSLHQSVMSCTVLRESQYISNYDEKHQTKTLIMLCAMWPCTLSREKRMVVRGVCTHFVLPIVRKKRWFRGLRELIAGIDDEFDNCVWLVKW